MVRTRPCKLAFRIPQTTCTACTASVCQQDARCWFVVELTVVGCGSICADDQQQKDRQKKELQREIENANGATNGTGTAAGKYTVSDNTGKAEKDKATSVDPSVRLPPLDSYPQPPPPAGATATAQV